MSEVNNPLIALAEWTEAVPDQWSDCAIERAEAAFIDLFAVSLPGANTKVVRKITPLVQRWGNGAVRTIGGRSTLSVSGAALLGGTKAHALDYDDNFDPAKCHATAVMGPALLAVADARGLSTRAVLDAYIVGLEVMGVIGQALNPPHRASGWHATGTIGALASAAAVARLIQLGAAKTAHALSVATSLAGGFISQFGTDTKALHAGLAAEAGVRAAEAAEADVTAGTETLDGPYSLHSLMVGRDPHTLARGLTAGQEHGQTFRFQTDTIGGPLQIETHGLKVKRFPNCGSLHRTLDGVLDLRRRHGFDAGDVAAVHVRAPKAHIANLMFKKPKTTEEAKFSLEHGVATALVRGAVTLEDYTADSVNDPAIVALYPIITHESVAAHESACPTDVEVRLKSGDILKATIHMPVGSHTSPLSRTDLWHKFEHATNGLLPPERHAKLRSALEGFRTAYPVQGLLTLAQHEDQK